MRTRQIVLLLSSCLMVACSDAVYIGSHDVDPTGWSEDSVLAYHFDIKDTTCRYDVLIHLRHLDNYPYQNMWLFIGETDSTISDTIEFYLADDRGIWLGNHGNGHISMPVLYEQDYRFSHLGPQQLYIRHGMRDSLLRGVSDISVEVIPTNR